MSDDVDPETGKPHPPSVFLERQSYRRRRLTDAARLLPILGAALFAVPLLWPSGDGIADERVVPLSSAMTYVFGIWALLIAIGAGFGIAARRWTSSGAQEVERE